MKLLKSCQVCRDGEQLKFLQKQIGTHILFKRYWQFSCCTGEARKCPWALRAAPCFSASRACTALCLGLLLAPWLQLYTGLCAGVRGWAGFAGALARSWLPRALNEGLIRATYCWLPSEERGMHWFKVCFEDANRGVVLWGEMLALS